MEARVSNQLSPELQHHFDSLHREISRLRTLIESSAQIPSKQYYRPSEVCRLLGWSRSKFESFKRAGSFPTYKIGGSVYVAAADVDKLLPRGK